MTFLYDHMTFLYWLAVYLFARIAVSSDTDWASIPLIMGFMVALAMLVSL